MVFIMPKINLTQYLRHVKRKVLASRIRGGDEEEDFVPFPRRWEKRDLSIHLPSFSLTNTDQYGKELDEVLSPVLQRFHFIIHLRHYIYCS